MGQVIQCCCVSVVVAAAGCATSPYICARRDDAADVFTATVGTGAGAKCRVGPVQVAAINHCDITGLRAGSFLRNGNNLVDNEEMYAPMAIQGFGAGFVPDRCGAEAFSFGPETKSRARGKDVYGRSPLPFIVFGNSPSFYSNIEVAAGLGLTLRLGFNPGELLDFFLGWWNVDIYGDDVEWVPPHPRALETLNPEPGPGRARAPR